MVRSAMLAVAIVIPSAAAAQNRSPNGPQDVSASKWVFGGVGFGATIGGTGYAATLAFLPTAGFGFRYDDIHGVEFAASFVRGINGNTDPNFVETVPQAPAIDGVTASWMTIRGSNNFPFNNALSLGVGAYREAENNRVNLGLQAYLETLALTGARGTMGFQLRAISIPNATLGNTMTIAVGAVLRSRPLGF